MQFLFLRAQNLGIYLEVSDSSELHKIFSIFDHNYRLIEIQRGQADIFFETKVFQLYFLGLKFETKKILKNLIKLRNMINYPAKGAGKTY